MLCQEQWVLYYYTGSYRIVNDLQLYKNVLASSKGWSLIQYSVGRSTGPVLGGACQEHPCVFIGMYWLVVKAGPLVQPSGGRDVCYVRNSGFGTIIQGHVRL